MSYAHNFNIPEYVGYLTTTERAGTQLRCSFNKVRESSVRILVRLRITLDFGVESEVGPVTGISRCTLFVWLVVSFLVECWDTGW